MYALFLLALLGSSNDLLGDDPPPILLVSKATHDRYMTFWPKQADQVLMDLRRRGVVFYDPETVPPAYQDWDSRNAQGIPLFGLHSPTYNIAASKQEIHGNANREFPWSAPAGLHASPNFKAIRFFSLPQEKPIVHWREKLPRDEGLSYVWEYPDGTTFGELLLVTDGKGKDHTFEVRTRTKIRKGAWRANVFRPVKDRADYQLKLAQVGHQEDPGWKWSERLKDAHPRPAFVSTALVSQLKPIPEEIAARLLELPFVSVLGQEWDTHAGFSNSAPTTTDAFHVFPKNHMGGFVSIDSKSCMTCHKDTLTHARDFDETREWYGRVRGSDNIFTFHIFAPSSLAVNGNPRPIVLNKKLVDAGLLKPHPAKVHGKPPEVTDSHALRGTLRTALMFAVRPRAFVVARPLGPMGRGGFGMMGGACGAGGGCGSMQRGSMMAAPPPRMFAPRAARMGSACAG